MKRKIFISYVLTLAMTLTIFIPSIPVRAEETTVADSELSSLDVMVSANSALKSGNADESILDETSDIKEFVELYSPEGELVAYYVSFNPNGYAVINNNSENPVAIEFGEGDNQFIREILASSADSQIIYNSPVEVYLESENKTYSNQERDDLYTNYPELNKPNQKEEALHNQQKEALQNSKISSDELSALGGGSYGFVEWDDMPSGSYSSGYIPFYGTDWATTGEYSDIANNHCGATAATNIALYYANRGYSNLKKNSSKRDTFIAVHDIIGNGPVMMIAGGTKDYFKNRGYTLKYSSVGTFSGIKSATTNNRPCGILLASGIVDWHWIVSTGWREYTTGSKYIRIVNGWDNTANNFYLINDSALWISATEYWIG